MNTSIPGIDIVASSIKRQIIVALIAMGIVLSLPFIAVISMGTNVLTFLASTSSVQAAATLGFYMGGPVPGNTYEWGNCTYWSYAMRLWAGNPVSTGWGNANTWDDRAEADGYIVNNVPTLGAIFQTDAGRWGHVAYVIEIDESSGDWTISEMNVKGINIVSTRTFSEASAVQYKFIHNKKGAAPWTPRTILNSYLPTGNLDL